MSVKLQSVAGDTCAVDVATGIEVAKAMELLDRSAMSYASPCTHG